MGTVAASAATRKPPLMTITNIADVAALAAVQQDHVDGQLLLNLVKVEAPGRPVVKTMRATPAGMAELLLNDAVLRLPGTPTAKDLKRCAMRAAAGGILLNEYADPMATGQIVACHGLVLDLDFGLNEFAREWLAGTFCILFRTASWHADGKDCWRGLVWYARPVGEAQAAADLAAFNADYRPGDAKPRDGTSLVRQLGFVPVMPAGAAAAITVQVGDLRRVPRARLARRRVSTVQPSAASADASVGALREFTQCLPKLAALLSASGVEVVSHGQRSLNVRCPLCQHDATPSASVLVGLVSKPTYFTCFSDNHGHAAGQPLTLAQLFWLLDHRKVGKDGKPVFPEPPKFTTAQNMAVEARQIVRCGLVEVPSLWTRDLDAVLAHVVEKGGAWLEVSGKRGARKERLFYVDADGVTQCLDKATLWKAVQALDDLFRAKVFLYGDPETTAAWKFMFHLCGMRLEAYLKAKNLIVNSGLMEPIGYKVKRFKRVATLHRPGVSRNTYWKSVRPSKVVAAHYRPVTIYGQELFRSATV